LIRNPKAILTILTGLNLLNYLDRYVVSAVLVPLQADLRLSNFVAGLLPTVFLIGYFATSPVFGTWGDRAGAPGTRRMLIAAGAAIWSAATIASGLATGTPSLIVSRAVVGVGEASFATLAPALIDAIAPRARKASWMAIYCAATPVGAALGYVVGGAVMHSHGWRAAFFVAGVPGLATALLSVFISDIEGGSARSTASVLAAWRALVRLPLYRTAVAGYCVYTFAIGGFAYWAPKYLHVGYGLAAGRASVLFGLVTVIGGSLGTVLGGSIADRASRRNGPTEITSDPASPPVTTRVDDAVARVNLSVCAAGCAIGAPLAAAAVLAATAPVFFAWTLPCQMAVFLLSGPINVALLRSAPPELRASAMALGIFAIHALGDLWSPPLMGLAADHIPMQAVMLVVPIGFGAAAFVWWRGVVVSGWLTAGSRVR
jgi:MFS family permease